MDLLDLGLASDVAGDMGDRPGFSCEEDADMGLTVVWVVGWEVTGLKLGLNLKTSVTGRGGS